MLECTLAFTVQNYITFQADSPDDAEWSEGGDLLVPPGRAVSEAVIAGLVGRGVPVGAISQHEYYGWAFSAGPYWCLLQSPGPWLAIVEDRSRVTKRLLRRKDAAIGFEGFLKTFGEVLRSDSRISEIRGYTKAEYEKA